MRQLRGNEAHGPADPGGAAGNNPSGEHLPPHRLHPWPREVLQGRPGADDQPAVSGPGGASSRRRQRRRRDTATRRRGQRPRLPGLVHPRALP